MRVVGGRLRRRNIVAPKGRSTRPTSERTREALFSMIESRVDLSRAEVLDVFAGSGALGIEALSRGAGHATFVDSSREAIAAIGRNLASLDLLDCARVVRGEAKSRIREMAIGSFDLIVADPPYDLPGIVDLPELLTPLLRSGGILALEHSSRIGDAFAVKPLLSRRYGAAAISLFENTKSESEPTN